jgi:hypothetical protein
MPIVDVPAGRIAYEDTGGDGPVLVFGHGLLMDGRQWRKVIPQLPEYRCITTTLPMGAQKEAMHPDADLSEQGVAGNPGRLPGRPRPGGCHLWCSTTGAAAIPHLRRPRQTGGRLVLASCTAFDNYPPKPARRRRCCAGARWRWLVSRLFGTRLFRHSKLAYGALTKYGLPTNCSDDWFGPAVHDPPCAATWSSS